MSTTRRLRTFVLRVSVVVIGVANACARPADSNVAPVADSASVARARAAADSLGPALMGKLVGALDSDGPDAAITFCADSAQALTARFAHDGVMIRRVGTRVRNPLNAPDSLEQRILAYYDAERAAGRPMLEVREVARTADDGGWELRLLRPVTVLERCTTCHGSTDQIPASTAALIAARYPDDKAVGYAAGDLRGAITVRIALPTAR
ncbi:MAG: DUF3365 domain-containing protein [Gemmatimonadaceae bacterium]|nr:DUF3365 domain-containing protein [Gemmatimonadaceae bacterium]